MTTPFLCVKLPHALKILTTNGGVNRKRIQNDATCVTIGTMLLHEAVQKARTDLGLSQKKLAELAGIQRKQLATLEKGGNITLATLRKVLVHLPNLETFQLDAVTTTVRREVPPQEAVENVRSALTQLGEAMQVMFTKIAAGGDFDEADVEALGKASDTFKLAYGW